jgi:hypothetical protein
MGLIKKKNKTPKIIIGVITIAGLIVLLATVLITRQLETLEIPRTTTIKIGSQKIKAEIVTTPLAAYRGLSNRPTLGADEGMLFNFIDKQEREFVMREMNFPLDIIFIADDRIIKIAANLPPEGNDVVNIYSSGGPVNQVLEVNGGYCREKGINVGDQILLSK